LYHCIHDQFSQLFRGKVIELSRAFPSFQTSLIFSKKSKSITTRKFVNDKQTRLFKRLYLLIFLVQWACLAIAQHPAVEEDSTLVEPVDTIESAVPGWQLPLVDNSPRLATPPGWQLPQVGNSPRLATPPFLKFLLRDTSQPNLPQHIKRKRIWIVTGVNIAAYGTTMIALYNTWYKNYPQTGFHTFNDWPEWQQVDKVGHVFSAYTESRASMELWRWTGIDRKKRIWIGGMSGAVYQTVIEVLDGFSAGWGWSWGDFGANIVGSGAVVAQELAWDEQRIKIKFSFHRKNYSDPSLDQRSDELFGKSLAERALKDYNGQAYWLSGSLGTFFPRTRLPKWFALAIGYGAEGMFGGTENIARDKDGNIVFDRTDINRYRQWYLSPDIDLTMIPTKSKFLKVAFTILSAFKFPAPALELSKGKLKFHALYF
jgi:uncharacterized protein YfiM (DUF2279 family)